MATYSKRLSPTGNSFGIRSALDSILPRFLLQRGSLFGLLILMALVAFEIFNYSTTEFALADLIGDLEFSGIRWATILAMAFCGMDFAGIARLFSPERLKRGAMDAWYLLGAWLLAATMNAALTWWAISTALLKHDGLGNEIVDRESLLGSVPVFVAIMVWLIRVLMIGSFTLSGPKHKYSRQSKSQVDHINQTNQKSAVGKPNTRNHTPNGRRFKPAPKPSKQQSEG
jgi:hypothetical protein